MEEWRGGNGVEIRWTVKDLRSGSSALFGLELDGRFSFLFFAYCSLRRGDGDGDVRLSERSLRVEGEGETVGCYGDETVGSYFVVKGRKRERKGESFVGGVGCLRGGDAGALFVWIEGRGWKGGLKEEMTALQHLQDTFA
jgi:hypothetical protein